MLALLLLACGPIDGGPGPLVGDADAWWRPFGGRATDEAWAVAELDGDVVFGSQQAHPTSLPDAYVYRIGLDGELVWESVFDGGQTDMVYVVTADEGVVYVGGASFTGLATRDADALVLALDAATGAELWHTTWDGGVGYEEIDGVVRIGDRLWVSGWTTGADTGNDLLLAELDAADGRVLRTFPIGSDGWDEQNGHLITDGERLYLAGRWDANGLSSGGDALVAAFDLDGNEVWRQTWAPTDGGIGDALGLGLDPQGGLVAVGIDGEGLGIWRVGLDGTPGAQAQWTGERGAAGRAVAFRADSMVVPINFGGDSALLELDGALGELREVPVASRHHSELHDLVLAEDGSGLVAGQTNLVGAGGQDALLVRFGADLDVPDLTAP